MHVVLRLRPQLHDWLFQGNLRRQGENMASVICHLDIGCWSYFTLFKKKLVK